MIGAIAVIATLGIFAVLGVGVGVVLHLGAARPEVVGPAVGVLALFILALLGSGKERRTR
jgi:hypothetical protein